MSDHDPVDDLDSLDELERPEALDEAEEAQSPSRRPHGDALTGPARGRRDRLEDALAEGEPPHDPAARERMHSFYDRLRGRVVGTLSRRGGRLGGGVAEALLLVPDMFMLLVRLALDPEVPKATRALIGGALAYFVLPFDLLPEGLLGGIGYLDDLVLAAAVLTHALSPELEERAQRYWSGRQELRVVLQDVLGAAQSLLGDGMYGRIERLLSRRGIAMPRPQERPADGRRGPVEGFEGDPGSELA